MQDLLEQLWQRRLRMLVTAVQVDDHEHKELANLAEHIRTDYHGRFLVELLQNANDQWPMERRQRDLGLGPAGTAAVVVGDGVIAVLNQGRPFNAQGLDSITSLGLSGKDAAIDVGNKGIGFKSVYEVTTRPVVLSCFGAPGEGLCASDSGAFCLGLHPFDDWPPLEDRLRAELAEFAAQHPAAFLAPGGENGEVAASIDRVLQAARQAAPFKFPVPVQREQLEDLLLRLALPDGYLRRFSTAVLLPIREGKSTAVEKRVRALADDRAAPAGSLVLTTPGISRLEIRSALDSGWKVHERRDLETFSVSGGEGFEVKTAQFDGLGGLDESRHETWMGARRALGADAGGREAVRAAIAQSDLPASWDSVDSGPVLVALPSNWVMERNEARERLCGEVRIGLPTNHPTGSAWYVDAHFHGNLSRKGLELLNSPYNNLLLEEAVGLAGAVLRQLRGRSELEARRLATLAIEAEGKSEFSDLLWAEGGPARGGSVLAADGVGWLDASEFELPADDDCGEFRAFERLVEEISPTELEEIGRIPEPEIRGTYRDRLLRIGRTARGGGKYVRPNEIKFGTFAQQMSEGPPLLARLAERERARDAGPEFWTAFLGWLVGRLDDVGSEVVGQVRQLPIVPTLGGGLSAPVAAGTSGGSERSRLFALRADQEDENGADPLDQLPPSLVRELGFLDEVACPIRQKDGRRLTALGRSLQDSHGLVRSPVLLDLTREVVGPALLSAAEERREEDALQLLQLLVRWTRLRRPLRGADLADLDCIVVPVENEDGVRVWRAASRAYFGPGWLDDSRHAGWLREAYRCSGQCLVPPDSLQGFDSELFDGLMELGVSDRPRIVAFASAKAELVGSRNCVIRRSNDATPPSSLPVAAVPCWERWLRSVKARGLEADTNGARPYHLSETCWVDGLERPESREAVFSLLLLHSESYRGAPPVRVLRGTKEYGSVQQLWVHALREEGWALVPTQDGRTLPPTDCWLLDRTQRLRRGARLLAIAAVEQAAWPLLLDLGAQDFEKPSTRRIAEELCCLASGSVSVSDRTDALRLTALLYGCLGRSEGAGGELRRLFESGGPLFDAQLPLQRGRGEVLEPVSPLALDEQVFIEDDAERTEFIPGHESALWVPRRADHRFSSLAVALAEVFGADRVRLTSKALVDVPFDPTEEDANLLEWLEARFGERALVAIAAVLKYEGGSVADLSVRDGAFARHWKTLNSGRLGRGTFRQVGGRTPPTSFGQEDRLMVDALRCPEDWQVAQQLWRLVGVGFQSAFEVLGFALRDKGVERYFEQRRLGVAEIDELWTSIGRGQGVLLARHLAALLVWAREADQSVSLERFRRVTGAATSLHAPLAELGLSKRLADLEGSPYDEGAAASLWFGPAGLGLWQEARRDLGISPWTFVQTERGVEAEAISRGRVLMSAAAHDRPEDAPLLALALDAAGATSEERQAFAKGLRTKAEVAQFAEGRLMDKVGDSSLGEWIAAGSESWTKREIDEYTSLDHRHRGDAATTVLRGILDVAGRLSETVEESLDVEGIRSRAEVQVYSAGTWANRFSLLAVLSVALKREAPITWGRMSQERTFREPESSQVALLARFPELQRDQAPPPPPPPTMVQAVGREMTQEEFSRDAAAGSAGALGKVLIEALQGDELLARLAVRGDVRPRPRRTARAEGLNGDVEPEPVPGSPVPGTGEPEPSPPERESPTAADLASARRVAQLPVTGLLGEAYVWEWLDQLLPAEAALTWVSKNGARYGQATEPDDGRGFDMQFVDVGGLLGAEGELCLVEVKATVNSSPDAFPMSANEWARALEASREDQTTYMIVRVCHAASAKPQVVDILVDPARMQIEGKLRTEAKSLWVLAGRLPPPE